MGLLARHRRFLAIPMIGALSLFWVGLVVPDLPTPPGPIDHLPRGFWRRATETADLYINGHYGFRGVIMAANRLATRATRRQAYVLAGERGQLFYSADQTLERVFGESVATTAQLDITARVARAIADVQAARGGAFVMISAPDVATVEAQLLPPRLRHRRRTANNYDLVMARLGQAGVKTVDLRPVFRDAKRGGPVQRTTDTHWNNRGAMIGYNATMNALGRPDLAVDPATALGPRHAETSGDLKRIAGLPTAFDDENYDILGSADVFRATRPIADPGFAIDAARIMGPYAVQTGHDGPSLLLIGDSYVHGLWLAIAGQKFGRVAFVNHDKCQFDWDAVKNFRADYIVLEMAERLMPCEGLPKGFPADPPVAANDRQAGHAPR